MKDLVLVDNAKQQVRDFWNDASCGESLLLTSVDLAGYRAQAQARYALEPYIADFARFETTRGTRVLEIGVGLGADHQRFAEAGAILTGIDLTPRAIEMTARRFEAQGLRSDLRVGDAEHLDFPDNTFDLVYSWGVIHHSPETPNAVREIFRVLRPGGIAKVMIYHRYSLVGLMLWLRYGLGAGRPWTPLREIYAKYLESPGTKAYSRAEARQLFQQFERVEIGVQLTHGDLLASGAGQRHTGTVLTLARKIWPRWFLKACCAQNGLYMLIEGTKPLQNAYL